MVKSSCKIGQFSKSFTVFSPCFYFQEGHRGLDWRPGRIWPAGHSLETPEVQLYNVKESILEEWLLMAKTVYGFTLKHRGRPKSTFSFLYKNSVMNLHT